MIRVLIADDEALVRGGLRMILEAQPDIAVTGEAQHGREALELTPQGHPRRGDDEHPHAGPRRHRGHPLAARAHGARAPGGDPHHLRPRRVRLRGDARRASGFLLKSARPQELIDAVRGAVAGDTLLAPRITRRLVEAFVRRPPPGTHVPPELGELTKRELEVLRHIPAGLSNAEITRALYVSEETMKTHTIGLRDRVHAVILAHESGLIDAGEVFVNRVVGWSPGTAGTER